MSRLAESLRKREEAWSSQHTHAMATLQKELQVNTHTHTPPSGVFFSFAESAEWLKLKTVLCPFDGLK